MHPSKKTLFSIKHWQETNFSSQLLSLLIYPASPDTSGWYFRDTRESPTAGGMYSSPALMSVVQAKEWTQSDQQLTLVTYLLPVWWTLNWFSIRSAHAVSICTSTFLVMFISYSTCCGWEVLNAISLNSSVLLVPINYGSCQLIMEKQVSAAIVNYMVMNCLASV